MPDPDNAAFFTTRWTLVVRAKGEAPDARAALADLCESYWMPVFRFLQREGRSEDDSRELTQEFFARILGGSSIGGADPAKGRFRSYLLGSLKHFLADRRRSEGRLKRGGGDVAVSLDQDEDRLHEEMPDSQGAVPDAWFDRQWALAVMERALANVEKNMIAAGKESQFVILKPWLNGDGPALSQTDAAAELGMSIGALKVAIHRLRQQFRDAVRHEIAQTLEDGGNIDEELRYLIEVLS